MQSESIANLAKALAMAQSEMSFAEKDSTNPAFKSKYADLASIWEACRKPLTNHGLAVIQRPIASDDGKLHLSTFLAHESGEWVESMLIMPVTQQTPHGWGSALTYARRYALAAMVGVVQDDDDGNEASKGAAPATTPNRPRQQAQAPEQPQSTTPPAAAQGLTNRDVWIYLQKCGYPWVETGDDNKQKPGTAAFRAFNKAGLPKQWSTWTDGQCKLAMVAIDEAIKEQQREAAAAAAAATQRELPTDAPGDADAPPAGEDIVDPFADQ